VAVGPNPTTFALAASVATAVTAVSTEIPAGSGMATQTPSDSSIASRSNAT
jgi:hypothetical protein